MIYSMKVVVFALLIFSLMPGISFAALQDWKIDVSINDDRTSEWLVTYTYTESVQNSDFFILAGVSDYNVTADGLPVSCDINRGIGSSIVCKDINAKIITYKIKTFSIVTKIQDLSIFTNRIALTQPTNSFSLVIRLPIGTVLADPLKLEGTGLLPVEPEEGQEGTDGRRIFVEWTYQKPELGKTDDFSVVFESARPEKQDFDVFIVVITAVIIVFLVFLVFFFRRRQVEEVLPVLTESERKVMEIVIREKRVDQRKIVKETDFSKAKASRIIQDLEKRGLIEKHSKGRTNIITLKSRKISKNIQEK